VIDELIVALVNVQVDGIQTEMVDVQTQIVEHVQEIVETEYAILLNFTETYVEHEVIAHEKADLTVHTQLNFVEMHHVIMVKINSLVA
jgi:hypothetical protein